VAIVTNAGGLGILTTDALEDNGLDMAQIADSTKEYMRSFLPEAASVKNPVDMIASATMEHYQKCTEACANDENVDAVIVIYLELMGAKTIDMVKSIMDVRGKFPEKPVLGVVMTTSDIFPKIADLGSNMPWYAYPEEAAHALARLWQQSQWQNRPAGKIPSYSVNKAKVEHIFAHAIAEGRDQLTTLESIDVLQLYGIRACKYGLATDIEQVKELGNSIGYPVVMKMTSKTTSHKTDVGGVVVNIQSEEQLENEYNALLQRLEAKGLIEGLEGVIIQEMVKGSREMVCGIATDPQCGPMMMFGLGGVFIEVMKDVTFRLAPLTDDEALEMIKSVKAYHLLEGARGTKPAQIEQIQETLLRLSQLVNDFKFIDELDINPLLISEKTGEGVAVDGRISVRLKEAKEAIAPCSCGCAHS
jgi:acetyltransferase